MIALCVLAAVLCLGLASAPPNRRVRAGGRRSFFDRSVDRRARQLRAARLHVDARRFTLVCLASPPLLFLAGVLAGSVVVAVLAGAAGFAVPRLYLDALVRAQRRRTEAEAPHLLRVMLASLTAGHTYLDMLIEARGRVKDRWLRDDLDHIITQFHLDVPLEQSIAEVRSAAAGRNLGLLWDNLAICIANHIPASRARGLLVELSSTVHFNVQLQQEVRARTTGQRSQIWMLAAIVPLLFFYLRFVNADFFSVLDHTTVGRFVLFPVAAFLEVFGVVLSLRVSRMEV